MIGKPSVGAMRHRVVIQNRMKTDDSFGQEPQTWLDVLSCYAQIEPVSGMSQLAAAAQQSSVSHSIFIRFRNGINARQRVVFGSRIFEIDAAINIDERSVYLQLECTEGLTAG